MLLWEVSAAVVNLCQDVAGQLLQSVTRLHELAATGPAPAT